MAARPARGDRMRGFLSMVLARRYAMSAPRAGPPLAGGRGVEGGGLGVGFPSAGRVCALGACRGRLRSTEMSACEGGATQGPGTGDAVPRVARSSTPGSADGPRAHAALHLRRAVRRLSPSQLQRTLSSGASALDFELDVLAVITLHSCIGQIMRAPEGVAYTQVARVLGQNVRDEHIILVREERRTQAHRAFQKAAKAQKAAAEESAAAERGMEGTEGAGAAGGAQGEDEGEGEGEGEEVVDGMGISDSLDLTYDPWQADVLKPSNELEIKAASFLIYVLLRHCRVELGELKSPSLCGDPVLS
ncbi:hypothetical protein T492DRAFT_848287 [Pavlovales sp. CCMP2436]|nr:hypothetical protein T492DRAFT_848287 [Pavlovales sp. CCMP2436]